MSGGISDARNLGIGKAHNRNLKTNGFHLLPRRHDSASWVTGNPPDDPSTRREVRSKCTAR